MDCKMQLWFIYILYIIYILFIHSFIHSLQEWWTHTHEVYFCDDVMSLSLSLSLYIFLFMSFSYQKGNQSLSLSLSLLSLWWRVCVCCVFSLPLFLSFSFVLLFFCFFSFVLFVSLFIARFPPAGALSCVSLCPFWVHRTICRPVGALWRPSARPSPAPAQFLQALCVCAAYNITILILTFKKIDNIKISCVTQTIQEGFL